MKNELFSIGPFTVYGYGLMIAMGIFAAYFVAQWRANKQKLDADQVFYLILCCIIGGYAGSKLLFWITEWREILRDPSILLDLADGFVVYGGILGGILTGYVYCRIKKLNFWAYFDLLMPSMALAQGFGRIGCLLAGCCYGVGTSCPVSITFQDSAYAPNGIPLIPTQIYSSLLNFLHFGILLWIASRKKAHGQVAGWYLIFYSIGRFVIECFRGDMERGSVGIFSTSQFIAVFTLAAGIGIVLWRGAAEKRKEKQV